MKRYVMQLVYTGAGSFAGYLYWQFAGSKSGEGFITSNLVFSVFLGAIIGFLLWGNMFYTNKFSKHKKQNSSSGFSKSRKLKHESTPTPLIHID